MVKYGETSNSQTVLNEENAVLPDFPPPASIVPLESIVFTADEVKSVLKLLPTGKASGPDGLSNRLLCELSNEPAKPYQCILISPYAWALYPPHIRKLMLV